MAYYAASSPPPPKAPSLAPTTNSELTSPPPPPPPVEEKKKKSFARKFLKELAGGGGNNVKIKGAPVMRPYGRGGVGVKPTGAKSQASLSTSSSKSPPSSLHQIQPAGQVPSPPPPATHLPLQHSPVDEDPRYLTNDYYAGLGGDYDDNQSTLSSIPAPRRTQQWIQQHAHHQTTSQLPSPPNSSTGAPSMYGNGGRDPYPMSPAPSQYIGSPYSRGSEGDPYYGQQQQYPGGYLPSSQARRGTVGGGGGGRLPDVDEDGDFDQQFGRLNIASPPNRAQYTSSPASIPTRRTPTVFSNNTGHSTARTPASQYAARYMANGGIVDEYRDDLANGRYDRSQYTAGPQQQQGGPPPPLDSATALVVEQYLARQGIAVPPGLLDQYRTTGTPVGPSSPAPTPAASAQTRELQSQIDALREAERKARERLEALRKDDGLRSGSTAPSTAARKDSDMTTRLDVMSHPSSADVAAPSRQARRPGTGDSGPTEGPSRQLTTQERALIEKEKLRQRDLEREREIREREAMLAASSSSGLYGQQPTLDPLTAALLQAAQQQQQQQNPLLQQQNLLLQALAAQQFQQAASAGGSVPPAASPTLGYGDMGQQNLIMQLGALLLQQQQQLQMLAAGRAAAASPVPSDPTMSPPAPPALDLNSLLALGALPNAQAGLAALLHQQQGPQSPAAAYPLPLLTTTAPSNSGHGRTTGSQSSISLDPPSPTTASTNNSILNAAQSNGTNSTSAPPTTSSRFSPNPTPSPKPSSKLERELDLGPSPPLIPPATAPLRLPDGLSRGGVGSFMREFNRELGLSPTTPTSGNDDAGNNGGSRMVPPRADPLGVPIPDVPARRIRRDDSPASRGTGPGTPPPAYMSSR